MLEAIAEFEKEKSQLLNCEDRVAGRQKGVSKHRNPEKTTFRGNTESKEVITRRRDVAKHVTENPDCFILIMAMQ